MRRRESHTPADSSTSRLPEARGRWAFTTSHRDDSIWPNDRWTPTQPHKTINDRMGGWLRRRCLGTICDGRWDPDQTCDSCSQEWSRTISTSGWERCSSLGGRVASHRRICTFDECFLLLLDQWKLDHLPNPQDMLHLWTWITDRWTWWICTMIWEYGAIKLLWKEGPCWQQVLSRRA